MKHRQTHRRFSTVIAALIATICFDACHPLYEEHSPGPTEGEAYAPPSLGAEAPKVLVVQASDFGCGFCARSLPDLKRMALDYPAEVRVEVRNFPLGTGRSDEGIARLALASMAQGAYWRVHRALFDEKLPDIEDPESLDAWATDHGLDAGALREAANGAWAREALGHDRGVLQALNVTGTPTYFVNGIVVRGAMPYWVLKRVIDDQIVQIDRRVAAGATREAALEAQIREQASQPELFWKHIVQREPFAQATD